MVALLLSGCGDPREPSKANFKNALEASWSEGIFDLDLDCHGETWTAAKQTDSHYGRSFRFCEALTREGYYARRDTMVDDPGTGRYEDRNWVYDQVAAAYYVRTDKTGQSWREGRKLIVGTPAIVEVVNYSEPQNVFGYTVAEVTYTYRVDGVPRWVTSEVLAGTTACVRDVPNRPNDYDCGEDFLNARKNPIQRTVNMVLTGEGWMTEQAYARLTDA